MSESIDGRVFRIRELKRAVAGLDHGGSVDAVRERLRAAVGECDASDVAAMEQELVAEGTPVERVLQMCDLHSQAVRDVLVDRAAPDVAPGHPVDTFRRENAAIGEQAGRMRASIAALAHGAGDAATAAEIDDARRAFGLLMDVDKHYLRKEHLLFPFLEKRGITGPSTVMWGKDDQARSLLKAVGTALQADDTTRAGWRVASATLVEPALRAVEEMIFKEDRILLPMALQALQDAEWRQVAEQSPQFGYCLVDPLDWPSAGTPAGGAAGTAGETVVPGEGTAPARGLVLPSGVLTLAQLQGIFATLPVDLTFVDADDRVRFFSEGRNRVFHRAKAVIGRKVQHCHPPASVGTVDRILADFRSGAQSVAEFWIQMRERFVHIRYFALRDAHGTYEGTLEVTQDLTRERALEGERRLLQYES
jgi:DUF438 domain-containing protein